MEAVHTSLQAKRKRDHQQNLMVESSVENLNSVISEDERLRLLGRHKMSLPKELKTIDEMINDRKLILGETSDLFLSPKNQD